MSRDFTKPKNQRAARANAISLISKHKYIQACAFWILSKNYDSAVNICIQHLEDPHLALLVSRFLYRTTPEKINEVIECRLLPFVRNIHKNIWKEHMLLWLLKKPEFALEIFFENKTKYQLSDATEIHSFVKYMKNNEMSNSVRATQAQNTSSNNTQSAAIFSSPLFDMMDMGDFDYNSGTFKSSTDNDIKDDSKEDMQLQTPFEPLAYFLASEIIPDEQIDILLRRAAVSYSRSGLLIHALEAIQELQKNGDNNMLAELQSSLLWRFLCVRATVMEHTNQIAPEQTKSDFSALSQWVPKFDTLSTVGYLYGYAFTFLKSLHILYIFCL